MSKPEATAGRRKFSEMTQGEEADSKRMGSGIVNCYPTTVELYSVKSNRAKLEQI